jgi:hypothetical protein
MGRLFPARLALAAGVLVALSVPANAQAEEPFSGSGTVDVTNVNVGDCFDDATYTVQGFGEPLGVFSGVGQQHVSYCEAPDIEGNVTLTAESGDQISLYYVGTQVGPTSYLCDVVVTGGTGQYEGATVDAVLSIENYSPGGPFDLAFDGTIRFA